MGCPRLHTDYYAEVYTDKHTKCVSSKKTKNKGRSDYRFGFNTQEKVDEIAGKGNHNTALFWKYDTKLGRRWNIDPVDLISVSNYAVNNDNPIMYNDPMGDCPTCKGGDEMYSVGATVENKDGKWTYQGDYKWKTESLNMGKSDKSFQNWFDKNGGVEMVDNVRDKIYEGKLSKYTGGVGKALYGGDGHGGVAVPDEITSRLKLEANAEAFGTVKDVWASTQPGLFASNRAKAVTSKDEGMKLVSSVAIEVAISWITASKGTGQGISIRTYPRAKGIGLNATVNGKRTIGLDIHKIRVGGRKTGTDIIAPHIDLPQHGIKHFPIKQIDKAIRGVK